MALNEWMQRGDTAGVPAAKSGLGVRSGFQVTFFSMSSLYLVPLMAAVTWLVKYRLYRRQPRKIYIRNPFPQNRRGRIIVHSKYLLCLDILFFSTSIQSNSKCQPSRQQSCQPSRPPRSTPASAWWCGGWRIMHPRLAPWLSVPSQPSSSPSLHLLLLLHLPCDERTQPGSTDVIYQQNTEHMNLDLTTRPRLWKYV